MNYSEPKHVFMKAKRETLKDLIRARFLRISEQQSEIIRLRRMVTEQRHQNRRLATEKGKQTDKVNGQTRQRPPDAVEFSRFLERALEERQRITKRYVQVKDDLATSRKNADELEKQNNHLKQRMAQLKDVMKNSDVPDRVQLQGRVNTLTYHRDELASKVATLERYVENVQKNHSIERTRLKSSELTYKKKCEDLQDELNRLKEDLVNKGTIIDVQKRRLRQSTFRYWKSKGQKLPRYLEVVEEDGDKDCFESTLFGDKPRDFEVQVHSTGDSEYKVNMHK